MQVKDQGERGAEISADSCGTNVERVCSRERSWRMVQS